LTFARRLTVPPAPVRSQTDASRACASGRGVAQRRPGGSLAGTGVPAGLAVGGPPP
jgi:hypothetical protein